MTIQESSAPRVTRLSKKRLGVQLEPRRKMSLSAPRDTLEKGSRMRHLERANIAVLWAALQSVRLSSRPRICTLKPLRWTAIAVFSLVVPSGTASAQSQPEVAAAQPATVRVDATPGHAINSFDPDSALGSSIDVLSRTGIDKVFTPHIVQESLSAGWGPITYRNNTEL